ncbi:ATP-dependent nuclease [Polaromonas sp. CT11-55]|uniref:ATP-dependent nuclease n=1 Tax=Polaromonas sp. CT11-55 TaxID=3243045 RepID=UPI0039A5B2AF
MFIETVHIQNYRSIRDGHVSFGKVTSFVGRNGVGKSTVLYALDSFYNVGNQYSHLDYYNHDLTATIRIRVTYGGLRAEEIAEFGNYVQDGRLTVTKVVTQGGSRYLGTTPQIPRFAELRQIGARERRNGVREMMESGELPGFPALPARGEDVDAAMIAYETAHPEMLVPIESESQFFGPRNVGGGKLDKFTKFVLVPAVKDAASETEKRGAIMQLLDLIVTRSINSRPDFLQFKHDFEQRARQLYGRENIPELSELGRLVTERLVRYAPGAELLIDFAELHPPAIPIPDAVVTVSEENFKVPVRYSGHGLQRALILALLEQLSMTRPPPTRQVEDTPIVEEDIRLPDLILAVEEPELYLHPARSRYLASILRELSSPIEDATAPRTQVVSVTHSPYFVDVEHFDEIRMCRKLATGVVGEPRMTVFSSFTRLQASQKLAELTGRDPTEFTATTFVARASPVLTSIVNEGLFADIAVVVEGESDVAALWAMQKHLSQNWDELGIVVIPVSGKSKMDRAVIAFQGFEIPTFFMFDGDRTKGQEAEANKLLLKLAGAEVVDFPSTTVANNYAVFEDDIETYLRETAGARYEPLRDVCAQRCGHTRLGTALKNPEIMQDFLRDAHAEGINFTLLRQIVETLTAQGRALRPVPIRQDVQPEVESV